jgi:hypothetical protein
VSDFSCRGRDTTKLLDIIEAAGGERVTVAAAAAKLNRGVRYVHGLAQDSDIIDVCTALGVGGGGLVKLSRVSDYILEICR